MDQLVAALEATLDPNQTTRVSAELLIAKLSLDPRASYSAFAKACQSQLTRPPTGPRRDLPEPRARRDRAEREHPAAPDESSTRLCARNRAKADRVVLWDLYAASFVLKKYVKEHWSPFFPTFKGPPATTVEVRSGLSQPVEAAGKQGTDGRNAG